MNIGLSRGPQKCFSSSPMITSAVRISTIFFSSERTKLNFGLPGIKTILSESAFSIELVNSLSLALDLILNRFDFKSRNYETLVERSLGTDFTFGEGRSITSLIHSFLAFFDWVYLAFSNGCDLLCL